MKDLPRPAVPPLYVVLHIYKTAGQTLWKNFGVNFTRPQWLPMYVTPMGLDVQKAIGSTANPGWIAERVDNYVRERATAETRCVFGHMAYVGIDRLVPTSAEPRYIVFLRDPVERIISLYFYLKHNSTNHWHEEIVANGWTIEEWLVNTQTLWIRDGQVRQLLIGSYPEVETSRDVSTDHLMEAERRLQQFWFVGLTETFAEDARYLYGKLGFKRFYGEPVVNATSRKDSISDAVRHRIRELNPLDMELYRFGQALRARALWRQPYGYYQHQLHAGIRRFVFERGDSPLVKIAKRVWKRR